MDKSTFDGLMESMQQAAAIAGGKRKPARTHHIKAPAKVDVKAIRKKLGMTQKRFSETFGFPLRTVASWESGERRPEKPARILLCIIAHNPAAVFEAVR